VQCLGPSSQATPAAPSPALVIGPPSPCQPCLNRSCLTSPAAPGLPHRSTPHQISPSPPRLYWPTTPPEPAEPRQSVGCAACRPIPLIAEPFLPDHASRTGSRVALLTFPCLPSDVIRRSHLAVPRLPFLALARPRLARRALPRSASPTSPNQQRQASASTVPTPCLPVLAWPCLTKPCLLCPSIPVLATLRHATPAPPSRLGRSDLNGPCLRNLGTPHVA